MCVVSVSAELAGLTVWGCRVHRRTFTAQPDLKPVECPDMARLKARAAQEHGL